jgi:hypothetical protein
VHNPIIKFACGGDVAQVVSFVQVLQDVPPDFPLQTIAVSRYRDTVMRDVAGWYIAERISERVIDGRYEPPHAGDSFLIAVAPALGLLGALSGARDSGRRRVEGLPLRLTWDHIDVKHLRT